MRQHITAAVTAVIFGSAAAFAVATAYKPASIITKPQTVVVQRAVPSASSTSPVISSGAMAVATQCANGKDGCWTNVPTGSAVPTATMSRAEQRQAAAQWGDLDQKEIDALTAALKGIDKMPVVIFCRDDALCGDMQLDLENAFESAKWDVKNETPLIDDTVGIATSSMALMQAINDATGGRLKVGIITKNAPYEALVIGKKPKA